MKGSWKYLATPSGVALTLAVASGVAAEFVPPGPLCKGFHGAAAILVTFAVLWFIWFGWEDFA